MARRDTLMLAAAVLLAAARPAAAEAPAPPKKAEDVYKNIQVLKGAPADQLVPAMQFIAASLGVDCEFCHVRGGFEKDDLKAKQTARKMMTMMMAINKDHFAGHREVTCFTCHHGGTELSGIPPVAETDVEHDEGEQKPPALPAATQILDRYVQALGGSEALGKIDSRTITGKITSGGQPPVSVDVYAKAPNKRASYVHMERGDSVTAFDGTAGWLGAPGRPPRMMSAPESESAAIDAEFRFPTRTKELFKDLEVAPSEKIGGHDAVLVIGRTEGHPPVKMYFDAQSGLLLRLMRYVETPLGRNPTQIDYDDYRDLDGIKVPYRWTVARPNGRFTIQAETVKQNVAIDDTRFTAPPADAPKSEGPKSEGPKTGAPKPAPGH